MLVRNCAGGLVFCNNKVFLFRNEKEEWVFPKGIIRKNEISSEVALERVKEEAGIDAEIVIPAGQTSYEFFSVTRQKPVCNKIIWYIMTSPDEKFNIAQNEKFFGGGYYEINKAMQLVTYSQDKALLNLSFKKYTELIA